MYRTFLELSREAVAIVAEDGTFVDANQAFSDICGYDSSQVLKMCAWMLWADPADQADWLERIHREGSVKDHSWTIRKADGELRHCLLSATLVRNEFGEVQYQCIVTDATDQRSLDNDVQQDREELKKRINERTDALVVANERLRQEIAQRRHTEQELLHSHQRFKGLYEEANKAKEMYMSLLSSSPDAIVIYDIEGRVQYVNEYFTKMFGWNLDEVKGVRLDFVPESEKNRTMAAVHTVLHQGNPRGSIETRRYTKDDRILDVNIRGSRYNDLRGNPAGLFVIIRDVTENKRTERDLRKSEEKYRNILENMEEGYYEMDLKGNMLFCNDSLARLLGYTRSELTGMSNRDYAELRNAKKMYRIFNRVYVTGESAKIAGWELLRKDGEPRLIEASVSLTRDSEGKPQGFRGIVRDITERKRLEDQLLQAQKMEAIGTLAGGIAHDFNNILYAISGYTELALDDAPAGSDMASNLRQVMDAANRARDLVNQILAFSRQRERERKPVQLIPMVKETVKFLRATIPSTVEIGCTIEPDLGMIMADPIQIHQVIMNLCTNSAHAMRETGGRLTLDLRAVHLDPESAGDLEISEGVYLALTIGDTGHGMTSEILSGIFEPFFTTKKPGEGTGLGLSVVHGIVKGHDGAIAVNSGPDKGTTFRVYFPLIDKPADGFVVDEDPTLTGTERILLVDDERPIAEMSKRILERLGYRVQSTTGSLDALELFQSDPEQFDLVITDMTMPSMTGSDLAAQIMRIRPGTPVILCTGFSELITEEQARAMGIAALVTKPILRKRIAQTIRQVLERRHNHLEPR